MDIEVISDSLGREAKEEILDLVDENDQVIGTIPRVEFYSVEQAVNNIRVVNAFIKNSRGELWIPKRTLSKKAFPGAYDFSVAGHVSSGETYEEAFFKEASEEINLDMNSVPYKEIGYFKDGERGLHCFMKVYEILTDESPDFNPEDFSEANWWTPEEVLRQAETAAFKNDTVALVRELYLKTAE